LRVWGYLLSFIDIVEVVFVEKILINHAGELVCQGPSVAYDFQPEAY
jgi:hypothetical protein